MSLTLASIKQNINTKDTLFPYYLATYLIVLIIFFIFPTKHYNMIILFCHVIFNTLPTESQKVVQLGGYILPKSSTLITTFSQEYELKNLCEQYIIVFKILSNFNTLPTESQEVVQLEGYILLELSTLITSFSQEYELKHLREQYIIEFKILSKKDKFLEWCQYLPKPSLCRF